MSKTLLNGVNDVLKRMGSIKSNSGELTSLDDAQRQVLIDLAVSCFNEVMVDVYESSNVSMPNELGSATITLVAGDRDYSLPSDLVFIKWPLRDTTNGYRIDEYPGGWDQLLEDQPQPGNHTGRPTQGVIRPTDSLLYLDRIPTVDDAGLQYTLYYDKSILKTSATDVFPFSDDVYYMLVPAVVEKMKMERSEQSEARFLVSMKKYKSIVGRAAGMVTLTKQRSDYTPYVSSNSLTDPLEE